VLRLSISTKRSRGIRRGVAATPVKDGGRTNRKLMLELAR